MSSVVQPIELLAPAKNLECGMAAVTYGADAVYIGAPKFGARVNAGNTLADIERLASFAHRYYARVYVTLNTIIFDHELEEARRLAFDAFHAGADALIIQDMSLLEMDMPPIPLFASTQTHNYSLERIRFLQDAGIRRIILARELSLNRIREIRSATHVELEAFVHGALCVSFSGQCYFSEATQGRSANRGECAQSCRMKYTLEDGAGRVLARDKHLLSLKDLNLSAHIEGMIEAGITSFKIEGRLKDIDYVKNIVSFYRQKLDGIMGKNPALAASSSGSASISFTPDPEKSFNRGMTQYFIRGRRKDIASINTPKSVGKPIGIVAHVASGYFELDAETAIANGDGICFFDVNDELQGVNVNKAEGRKVFPQQPKDRPRILDLLRPGMTIYRNFDKEFIEAVERDRAVRRIPVRIAITAIDGGLRLAAEDGDGIGVSIDYPCGKTPARDHDRAFEAMRSGMKKSGDSIFTVTDAEIAPESVFFFPASALNAMRRALLAALENERELRRVRPLHAIVKNSVPYPVQSLDFTANIANHQSEAFYRRHGVASIAPAFELESPANREGAVIMTTKHCLKFHFGMCEGRRVGASAGEEDAGSQLVLRDSKRAYRLEFDCDACMMKIIFEGK
ncbi:MAG: peptidase U32 family protein [Acidobacteriota bacterium]